MQVLFSRRSVLVRSAAIVGAGPSALSAGSSVARAAEENKTVTIAIQYGYAYLPVTVAEKLGLFAKQAKAAGLAGLTVMAGHVFRASSRRRWQLTPLRATGAGP